MQYKKLLMWSVLAASIAFASCKKQLDINTDPNNPNLDQLTSKLVFPAGVASSVGRIGGQLAIVGGIWSQYYTQSVVANQFKNVDAYNLTKGFGTTNTGVDWVELYSGALNDLVFVQKKSLQDNRLTEEPCTGEGHAVTYPEEEAIIRVAKPKEADRFKLTL